MPQSAETIFRDFTTDGIQASGLHEPRKVEIREWGTNLEAYLSAGAASASLLFTTLASLNGQLGHPAATMAWVIGDAVAANNGVYQKLGASGAGSWQRRADLPFSFIRASDVGDGTPNAIQATSSIPIPSADAGALIALNVFEANTASPVTVSFNGGAALTIKTNSGNDIGPGGLTAGMIVAGYVSGSTFRLLSDQATSAIVVAAEAAAGRAEQAALDAEAAAASAIPTMLNVRGFGAVVDGTTDDTTAIQNAVTSALNNGTELYLDGNATVTGRVEGLHDVKWRGPGSITRGGSTFYVEPKFNQPNTLYVDGNAADDQGDGITPDHAVKTLSRIANILGMYGPVIRSTWEIVGAASTVGGANFVRKFMTLGPSGLVKFRGPEVPVAAGETIEIIHGNGLFATVGETITGGTSGFTATVLSRTANRVRATL